MVLGRLDNNYLVMIEYLIIFVLVISAIFARRLRYLGYKLHKLPGPQPLPLIGSVLDLNFTAESKLKTNKIC